jgi:phospholipase/carboxylesterase
MAPPDDGEDALVDAVGALGPPLLQTLDALEKAARYLHPPLISGLRRTLAPLAPALEEALRAFETGTAGAASNGAVQQLGLTGRLTSGRWASSSMRAPAPTTRRVLSSLRVHALAQAALYPLHSALPPVNRYFLEPALWPRAEELDPDRRSSPASASDAHQCGGSARRLHVLRAGWLPPDVPRPLVVALHGGSGHGSSFLWSWLREARSAALPALRDVARSTWSLHGADHDADPLDAMIAFVSQRWPVDPARILVTGLSDSATYSLLYGLRASAPCSAIAPVSGVLHPVNFANGNMQRARGRRIHLVHGRLDWLFPVGLARAAAEELERAGADLVYAEIEDLSHTYPREANDAILSWFDPTLALPGSRAG